MVWKNTTGHGDTDVLYITYANIQIHARKYKDKNTRKYKDKNTHTQIQRQKHTQIQRQKHTHANTRTQIQKHTHTNTKTNPTFFTVLLQLLLLDCFL
jgi:hypothetical protein